MNKKLVFTVGLLITAIFTFATTFSFAADDKDTQNMVNDATNNVRNVVGGAENAVDGAVKDIGNTMKDSADKTGNTMNNIGNTMTENNDTNYTANRTATTRTTTAGNDNGTFLGMNSTTWTWIILAIAAVAIVGLVWYYSNQITNTRRYDDGE